MSFESQKNILKHIEPSSFPATHSVPFYRWRNLSLRKNKQLGLQVTLVNNKANCGSKDLDPQSRVEQPFHRKYCKDLKWFTSRIRGGLRELKVWRLHEDQLHWIGLLSLSLNPPEFYFYFEISLKDSGS